MKTEENELTFEEVEKAHDYNLTTQQKYDMASVIDSLSKLGFFADASEEDKLTLKRNVAVLEKMLEKEEL